MGESMIDLEKFDVYLVGGFVRDRLLGRDCHDHDFVVVGATPQDLKDCGFQQVGADFPVFLNENGDEFALARTERKVGVGYNGFEVAYDPSVTLEDDLLRRDLTINAMARKVISWKPNGHAKLDDIIIDPFGGQEDLRTRTLRHVSEAFAEDPLRVLRIARFRTIDDKFEVAEETMELISNIVKSGELNNLTKERVWKEYVKIFLSEHPIRFYTFLRWNFDMRDIIFPGWTKPIWTKLDDGLDLEEQMALTFVNTDPEDFVKLCEKVDIPKYVTRLTSKLHKFWHNIGYDKTGEDWFDLLQDLNLFVDEKAFNGILKCLVTSLNVQVGFALKLAKAHGMAKMVKFNNLSDEEKINIKGKAIGARLREIKKQIFIDEFAA